MRGVDKSRRGAAANTNYAGADVGNLIGPVIAGRIVEAVQQSTGSAVAGYSSMYRWMIIPIGIALALYLLSSKKLSGKK